MSSDLLAEAGFTLELASGLFSLLPLGLRVLHKLSALFRQEMERVGAQEVAMPLLQPEALWARPSSSGVSRAAAFNSQLFHVRGGDAERWVLAPTHEEVATTLAAACVRDARDLPRILYQIQPRFRDQPASVRAGLFRTREFVMADAYSFHSDPASLAETYVAVRAAFHAFLARCGVNVERVMASSGAMGGEDSEELIAPLPRATTAIGLSCVSCDYAASAEVAELKEEAANGSPALPLEEVGATLDDLAGRASEPRGQRLLCRPFLAGRRVVLAVLPADRPLNLAKLGNALFLAGVEGADLREATADDLTRRGGTYDWVSLVRTPSSIFVIADDSVRYRANFSFPGPRAGRRLVNLNSGRDFRVDQFSDLAAADEDDPCPRCGAALRAIRGTEVGHIFKLGAAYTSALGAQLPNGEPLQMGCYGLGLTRILATLAEQRRDIHGMVWPTSVAPYTACVIPAGPGARDVAARLYADLCKEGIDVLLDDTDGPPEERIRRAALLGIPFLVHASEPRDGGPAVEIRERGSERAHETQPEAAWQTLKALIASAPAS